MKTFITTFLAIAAMFASASWIPFGPQGNNALNACFNLDASNRCMVCTDTGFYLGSSQFSDWQFYTFEGFPVWQACFMDGSKIMMIMGDGAGSDGIYSFDPSNGSFQLLNHCLTPHFICHNPANLKYYAGSSEGVLVSDDGYNWNEITYFDNKNIVSMDCHGDHIVASEVDNLLIIHCSHDAGNTWNQATTGSPWLSSLKYNPDGIIYGVFPDESWSSGLWSSPDHGETWNNEFYSVNMSATGMDLAGNIFVGWAENPMGQDEGIAMYDPATTGLTFLNEGLPVLIVNEITHNPGMSALAIFCCTEGGAFYSIDYMVGTGEIPTAENDRVTVFPVPCNDYIHIAAPDLQTNEYEVALYDQKGSRLQKFGSDGIMDHENLLIRIDLSGYDAGVYFVGVKDGSSTCFRKIVVAR